MILRAQAQDRTTQDDLNKVFVQSNTTGKFIPLSNFVSLSETAGASELKRTDRLRAIRLEASLGDGYTLNEAVNYLEQLVLEEAGDEARISFGGLSRTFKESNQAMLFTFVTALLVVFLALAAQFESFIHPVIIMTSVPLAITGALGAMLYFGISLNVYSQIGVIMLIGLTAKNAILIVEFANQLREEGLGLKEAVVEASVIRLRPILMTTISTALGAVPLAMATGAGAESREAIGIVVMGGVIFSTVLSLGVVPVFYLLLARFSKPTGYIADRLRQLEHKHVDVEN